MEKGKKNREGVSRGEEEKQVERIEYVCSDPKKVAHLLLQYNVVLTELNPFIWRIKTNRPLIHIIINHAAAVHRAEGHNNSLQKLRASLSRNTSFVPLIMLRFPYYCNKQKHCCPRTAL